MTATVLNADHVPDYVASQPALSAWGSVTEVAEIGDGNINNVFRVTCAEGSFVLKQSMPYVRIDPTWDLTPTRIDHEAAFYRCCKDLTPPITPQLYLFDAQSHAIVVEDLGDHEVWRHALTANRLYGEAASHLGSFIAGVADRAKPWAPPTPEQKQSLEEAVSPVMARLMEDVVFRFPYEDHPHNSYVPDVAPIVERLRGESDYRAGLDALHDRWYTHREALIHGDLHTGSVMVAPGSTRLIDAEFSTVGPIAWDLGELIGNLLIADIYARVTGSGMDVGSLLSSLWSGFDVRLADLADQSMTVEQTAIARWSASVREDATGYAGAELVRRVIGSGKADEIAALSGLSHVQAVATMLTLGRELVMRGSSLSPAKIGAFLAHHLSECAP